MKKPIETKAFDPNGKESKKTERMGENKKTMPNVKPGPTKGGKACKK